jgi:putative IMPACT (imprinted ancient) family translation regulator
MATSPGARCALAGPGQAELVVERSRFLAYAQPVADEDSLVAWLAELRRAHPSARHRPYAWVAPDGGARVSDDGEPPGTGGRPCLAALRGAGAGAAAVAVVRIFGGVRLGTVRLARAYGEAAARAVAAAGTREVRLGRRIRVAVPHGDLGRAERACRAFGARVEARAYGEAAVLTVWVPEEAWEAFAASLPPGCWQPEGVAWR